VCNLKAQYRYNIFQDGSDKAKRFVTKQERYAIIKKPLGIILEEKENGMVYIANISPNGNAAQSGFDVRVGDVVVAVSATFGDEIWSTRGVGLEMVLKAVKIRSGDFITIVLEDPIVNEDQMNLATQNALQKKKEAREKFGAPVILDPVTLTPINSEKKEQTRNTFFKFF